MRTRHFLLIRGVIVEIWKDIKGYEGKYQISNLGRVKSLKRNIKPTAPYQKSKTCKERILKDCVGSHGYKHVSLEGKKHCIHRLVATAFTENNENYNCINHKDGNKLNNSIDNLEWCSYKRNADHMFNTGLREDNIRIKAIFNEDDTVMIFRSKAKARKYLKLSEKALNKGIDNGEIKGIQIKVIDKI